METRFNGQSAIVSGGASGIGRAVAHRLALEGASVTIFDQDESMMRGMTSQFSADGLKIITTRVDITEDSAVREAITNVAQRIGRLDIVVHCAGVPGPTGKRITDVSTDDFERVCRVNLLGSFIVIKHSLPHMQQRNYGRILLFASIAGKEGNAGMCSYSASKAGVIGLVKSIGKEFAETGITVNAIAPAVIQTPMVDRVSPEQVKYMTDRIPMKRCGTLDEIASLACWVVSPEASFNTAFTFDLSGGRATY